VVELPVGDLPETGAVGVGRPDVVLPLLVRLEGEAAVRGDVGAGRLDQQVGQPAGVPAAGRHAEQHVVQVHHDGATGRRGDREVRPLAQRDGHVVVPLRPGRDARPGERGDQGGGTGQEGRAGHHSGLW